jgi:O-antigen/teichoic acid export membrane protein
MNRQVLNIIANFSGVGARLAFALAFNIIYFRLLGSEGFGLIGFYASLAGLGLLFDFGLGQTTIREVARRNTDADAALELRGLVLTLQALSGGIGLALGAIVVAAAPWISSWFSAQHLSPADVRTSVRLMGGVLALQLPVNFLYGTLIGLQRQVLSNALLAAATGLRGALSIVALLALGADPAVFFATQIAASAIEFTIACVVVRHALPIFPRKSRLERGTLRDAWKFASCAWLAVTFAQFAMLADKLILSTLLPLHVFGLFSLATAVAGTVQRLAPPFTNAYFPHFVRLIEQRNADALARAYRRASEAASAVFLAAGLSLVVYAAPLAQLMSTDQADAGRLGYLLAILAAANTLNVEMALPFSLLFAHGNTAIALRINLVLCALYLSALVLLVPGYGVNAATQLWLAANLAMLPVLLAMTDRAVLPGMAFSGFARTIGMPDAGIGGRGRADARCRRHAASDKASDAGLDRGQRRACARRRARLGSRAP